MVCELEDVALCSCFLDTAFIIAFRILILIIIITSLGQILLSYIENTSRTHARSHAHTHAHTSPSLSG